MPATGHTGLIRDAELEAGIRAELDPILRAANLSPGQVRLFLVQDAGINAFVMGGSNMFIHTGLIQAAETPDMLIGVMAHETGHIAGGHLARGAEAVEHATVGTIMAMALGAATAVAGGGEAGAAIMQGGSEIAKRQFMAHSRANEQAADQAALGYLQQLGVSADGMLRLFEKLRTQERRYAGKIDPYAVTHPLSTDRITHIRSQVMRESVRPIDAARTARYDRLLAKLNGFLMKPELVFNTYTGNTFNDRYARAIARHRNGQSDEALAELDALLGEAPDDAYLIELKGQVLAEKGDAKGAEAAYARASSMLPESPLIRMEYARTLLAQQRSAEAETQLNRVVAQDATIGQAWEMLSGARMALGHKAEAALASAEAAMLMDEPDRALLYAKRALEGLPAGSPGRIRAEDIQREARERREKGPVAG